jgi:mono/diheme cytochrome c family protein
MTSNMTLNMTSNISTLRLQPLLISGITCLIVFCNGISFAQSAAANKSKSPQTYAELAKAPEKWRTRENPLAADPDAVAAGRKLFEGHCAECHGETASGGRKGPSLRAQEVQQATPGAIFWVLTNGVVRRGMPVWSKLPEPQRWQIVTYLKSLGLPATPNVTTK